MRAWEKAGAAALVCIVIQLFFSAGAAAQDCSAQNICSTDTQSNGAVTNELYESDGRRNDNYQTRITGRIGEGEIVFDEFVYRDITDPMAQAALDSAREAVRQAGGETATIGEPLFVDADFSEELDQVFTETSEFFRPGGTVVTVQTTSGDADTAIILIGDRGNCFDFGASGPTNVPPYTGLFPNCDGGEQQEVPPFTVNTNTHTTEVTDHVYSSFTNEDYIIRQHYAVIGATGSIVVAPAALPVPLYDQDYRVAFGASGGTGPYRFAPAGGSLPTGLALAADGTLSGTPSAYGTFNFSIMASDVDGASGVRSYQVVVADPGIDFSPQVLVDAVVGEPYDQQLTGMNGRAPYSFELSGGSLPPGLTLTQDGRISGTATATGIFSFNIWLRDANWLGPQRDMVLRVAEEEIAILPATLPDAAVGQTYAVQFSSEGGTAPYRYEVAAGELPDGLTLSEDGALSGTVMAAGSFPLRVRSIDAAGQTGEAEFTLAASQATPSVLLSSDRNPAESGEAVTFTASLDVPPGAPPPTGPITFLADGREIGSAEPASGSATLSTSALAVGAYRIVAVYGGDVNYRSATSAELVQTVRALGTVVLRQIFAGRDGTFAFASDEPGLNLSITTSGGTGQSGPVSLPPGRYVVRAQDRRAEGYALTSITCDDGDSGRVDGEDAADIRLVAGENVTCTFASTDAREITSETIREFMETRASLILENQPDLQRRIDRLNGATPGDPAGMLANYLPGLAGGRTMDVSASLAMLGPEDQAPSPFDVWVAGSFVRFDVNGGRGRFGLVTAGADYRVNDRLLVGAFVQGDWTDDFTASGGGTAEGTGWLAGPYLTARLSDRLYLDLLAGGGRSANSVNASGLHEDDFDATRWLVAATLQGDWTRGAWTISPRLRIAYFSETSEGYVDGSGVAIPAVEAGLGHVAFGPAIAYRQYLEDGATLDYRLRLDGIVNFGHEDEDRDGLQGRLEAGLDAGLVNGMRIGVGVFHGGVGLEDARSYGATLRVSMPFN